MPKQEIIIDLKYGDLVSFGDIEIGHFFTVQRDVWLKITLIKALKVDTGFISTWCDTVDGFKVKPCKKVKVTVIE